MEQKLDTDAGRVNLTFDMAQFWSLYVQDLIGSSSAPAGGQLTKAQYAEQNTCLTGVYVRSLADRQLIERGDTETVNAWVGALSASANGITAPDVSSTQLRHAFARGFQGGDPAGCGPGGGS